MRGTPSGRELLEQASAEVADVERSIREHPFLGALEAGQAPRSALEALAAEQHLVISSDRRSFAQLAARFPEDPTGAFFLSMAEGEGLAFGLLHDFAAAVGVERSGLRPTSPVPTARPTRRSWRGWR